MNIFHLKEVGLTPDLGLAEFATDRLEELQKFCKNNPDYHILSAMPGGELRNCIRADARCYKLCAGNPNPRLICKAHLLVTWFEAS